MTQEPMPTRPPADEAEQLVRDLADRLLAVHAGECLACYLRRMVHEHGCAEHRFVDAYRAQVAPRATALARRLERLGGFCDCEVLANAFVTVAELEAYARVDARRRWAAAAEDDEAYEAATDALEAIDADALRFAPAPCDSVRRGSTQPCERWRTVRVDHRMRW